MAEAFGQIIVGIILLFILLPLIAALIFLGAGAAGFLAAMFNRK